MTETEKQQLRVVGAWKLCNHLDEEGTPYHKKVAPPGEQRCYRCVDADTPGRIMAFSNESGVRVRCPLCLGRGQGHQLPSFMPCNCEGATACPGCHGRGFTATQDIGVMLEAMKAICGEYGLSWFDIRFYPQLEGWSIDIDDALGKKHHYGRGKLVEAVYVALEEALLANGWNLGESKEQP